MIRLLLIMTAREVGGAELYVERLINALNGDCEFTVAMANHPAMEGFRKRLGQSARVVVFPFDLAMGLASVMRDLRRLAASHNLVHINSNHPASRLGILAAFVLGGRRVPVVCVEHRVTPVADIRVPATIAWAL